MKFSRRTLDGRPGTHVAAGDVRVIRHARGLKIRAQKLLRRIMVLCSRVWVGVFVWTDSATTTFTPDNNAAKLKPALSPTGSGRVFSLYGCVQNWHCLPAA